MITNAPREASIPNVLQDISFTITEAILEAQTHNIAGVPSLQDIQLPHDAKFEAYLHQSKVLCKMIHHTIGGGRRHHLVSNTNATIVHADKDKSTLTQTLLQTYTKTLPNSMKFVPFHLKFTNPNTFGRLLNVSIVETSNM